MHAPAIGVPELTGQLLDAAGGIPADAAAAGPITSHGHVLHRGAFRRTITAGTSISTGQPPAVISRDAALHALEGGLLPCASPGQAIVRIAARPADPATPVRLRAVPGNLGTRTITPAATAITTANG
jgi:hypothetical protein